MKVNIKNISYNYTNNKISLSATVQITDDADNELWTDGISYDSYISKDNWYAQGIASLIEQKNKIVNLYVQNMTKILSDTGKSSIEEILSDVQAQVEAG